MKIFFLFSLALVSHALRSQPDMALVDDFVKEYSSKNETPISEVQSILDKAQFQPKIIERMQRPAEGMPWYRYRKIFLTEDRIQAGAEFWSQNQTTIASVSNQTGVSPEVIVSIIGVESAYGKIKGSYRVLDALYTLAFGYPRRSKFFKSELEHFLLLAKEENIDPLEIKGSYAGAIGYCQFMPSSYRAYAKSFEQNSNRDLMNSAPDAIASVANYLKVHKWKRNGEIATKGINVEGRELSKQSLKPSKTFGYYQGLGFNSEKTLSSEDKVTLLEFEGEDEAEFWFGFTNFYAITRYNHSKLYALAVYQLSQEIVKAKGN